ncbi:MAG: LD-carboxypeptidase [Myxococcota bacterium]|nr:LD-carboxypeptidase [Myxococcota bacterium]
MPRLRKPHALQPGDVLGVVAPAFAADAGLLRAGCAGIEAAGFGIRRRKDVLARKGYLAGDDARRVAEFEAQIASPEIAGLICARGGYGSQRLLPSLDPEAVRQARKPLVGFSDITSLLLWQLRCAGLVGFHGPVLERQQPLTRAERHSLLAALSGELPAPFRGKGRVRGVGRGRLVGGSLTLLAASLGTPWEVQTQGAILLFEEVAEKPYALDRLLVQLQSAGKLDGLAGIGVGHLEGCVDPKRSRPSADAVVVGILSQLGIPLVTGLPFGHRRPNLTWPLGVRAEIDGTRGELRFLEPGAGRRRAQEMRGDHR